MIGWQWLRQPPLSRHFMIRVLLKAVGLFILFNLLFALLNPMDFLGSLSIHNHLVPGRVRLPYGEDADAYNLSLDNLNAMFASHEITQSKPENEFRVGVIGDSNVWGILLRPEETLAGQLNGAELMLDSGQQVRAYNLGHPILALSKDLLILDHTMRYEPDMIVWLTTLRSFVPHQQVSAPLVRQNADHMRRLFALADLDHYQDNLPWTESSLLDKTIVGQRRALADLLRLQVYSVMWATTGIDQVYPAEFDRLTANFDRDQSWEQYAEAQDLTEADLAFDILRAGHQVADGVPVLLVNEPIYISDGANSDLRYNLWYPRWAYDAYRQLYQQLAASNSWFYLDLWDMIDPSEFTDSPVHMTATGADQLAQRLAVEILSAANNQNEGSPNG